MLSHVSLTPQRITCELPQQVEEVRGEVDEQFVPPVTSPHAEYPAHAWLADQPRPQRGECNLLNGSMPPPRVRHHQMTTGRVARGDHLVDLGR